jgi:hypothetical protein
MVPLIAILGAGASRASGDYGGADSRRPPLTVELFDEGYYGDVLSDYELAHQAGRYITHERAADDTLALEAALHGLRTSKFDHHKHMAIAVPLYLQQLLHAVSDSHFTDAFRYDSLIERLLRLPYVFFLTLNYDVLLDRRLNTHHLLSTFDDYISTDKNWSLIKLHGSVTWFHPTRSYDPRLPPRDLDWDSSTFECVAPNARFEAIRGGPHGVNTDRYPALALPEGPEDRLVLPRSHSEFFHKTLPPRQEVDLLVIGYSGLDKEVLRLLAAKEPTVRHMTIVGRDVDDALNVLARFRDAHIQPVWEKPFDGDFATWVDGGGLNQLVDEFGGPYSS